MTYEELQIQHHTLNIVEMDLSGVEDLQGQKGFRLRVGNFRIIFDIDGNVLLIEKIDNREQIYKGV